MLDLAVAIDEYLSSEEDTSKERTYFYISELGKSRKEICESMRGQKKSKYEARVKRIFHNGDYMHTRYYKYLAEMGMLVAAEVTAVENELFHGRADAIISDKKQLYVLDLKSCSQWTFNKLTEPQYDHKLQVMFYCYYLNIPNGMILYENKDNQSVKVFHIPLDKELVEKYIQTFIKLKEDIINGREITEEPITINEVEYAT